MEKQLHQDQPSSESSQPRFSNFSIPLPFSDRHIALKLRDPALGEAILAGAVLLKVVGIARGRLAKQHAQDLAGLLFGCVYAKLTMERHPLFLQPSRRPSQRTGLPGLPE